MSSSHVQSQIDKVRIKYDKFKDLVMNTDTSSNVEFKDLRKGLYDPLTANLFSWNPYSLVLVKDLRAVDKDLKGLREAVEMVRFLVIFICSFGSLLRCHLCNSIHS